MLSVSQSLLQQNRSVRFSSEVDAQAERRAIREDRKKVNKLLLQSDVAFRVDKAFSLRLLEEAKSIIDKRFSDDESLKSSYSNRKEWF